MGKHLQQIVVFVNNIPLFAKYLEISNNYAMKRKPKKSQRLRYSPAFGHRLWLIRDSKKETQEAFAKKLGLNSASAYQHYEYGREPPFSVLLKLKQEYNASFDYLIGAAEEWELSSEGPKEDAPSPEQLLREPLYLETVAKVTGGLPAAEKRGTRRGSTHQARPRVPKEPE